MITKRVRTLLVATALALVAQPAWTQGPLVATGTRLRATTVQNEWVIGRSTPSRADSLVLIRTDVGLAEFRLSELRRLEVSGGRSHLRGASRGTVRGATAGGVLMILLLSSLPHEHSFGEQAGFVGRWVLLGGAIGGTVGLIRGSEVWTEVHPIDRVRR